MLHVLPSPWFVWHHMFLISSKLISHSSIFIRSIVKLTQPAATTMIVTHSSRLSQYPFHIKRNSRATPSNIRRIDSFLCCVRVCLCVSEGTRKCTVSSVNEIRINRRPIRFPSTKKNNYFFLLCFPWPCHIDSPFSSGHDPCASSVDFCRWKSIYNRRPAEYRQLNH